MYPKVTPDVWHLLTHADGRAGSGVGESAATRACARTRINRYGRGCQASSMWCIRECVTRRSSPVSVSTT